MLSAAETNGKANVGVFMCNILSKTQATLGNATVELCLHKFFKVGWCVEAITMSAPQLIGLKQYSLLTQTGLLSDI